MTPDKEYKEFPMYEKHVVINLDDLDIVLNGGFII